MNTKTTKDFLKRLEAFPKKSLGQNFLINSRLARKIVGEVRKTKEPYVEIGPGPGALTRFFRDEKKGMLLIEKDKKIAEYWKAQGFSVLVRDALKMDLADIPPFATVFGNLPYQLAGPLILKISSFSERTSALVFMLQKEVGLRVLAKPRTKDYGLLSVMAQTFWHVRRVATACPADFYPVPKVSGSVLKLLPKKPPVPVKDFLIFLKLCFAQRRKKLFRRLPVSPARATALLLEINQSADIRAEELAPPEFVRLFEKLSNLRL